ncbi:Rieske (2Fe-2S) protein [Pseudoxanthomonas sp. Root630]|uniref:QcrA and Rieske domain-containing protein n=1 Tax=Pseudoxanthomonas sp. Root630 TaxID=1736574 RepID=UPI0007037D67|nr:Rieske (2Fe-2S) protein [Pseudoxanthomonas sp. Root630]KRA46333.1 (2Fe-2S)-binding protein [Pseudoxanthomonas sp. Root630]
MSETKEHAGCACACTDQPDDGGRRSMLTGALALAALAPMAMVSSAASAQAAAPAPTRGPKPEPGDKLAFMIGPKAGKEVKPADIEVGKPPVLAYPMDPATGKVLISKANLLTVVRLKPADLKPTSARNAADGIVAFSSLCTHYGCPITTLHPSQTQIVCNCHGSVFDAANRGAVTQGPATRRLAMLPLTIKDGALVVSGKFDGPLGPPTT